MGERQEGRSDGDRRSRKDVGGVDKLRETMSRTDCMKNESNFNKKKTKNEKNVI